MTPMLIGKDLVFGSWSPKIEDEQVPGMSVCTQIFTKWKIEDIHRFQVKSTHFLSNGNPSCFIWGIHRVSVHTGVHRFWEGGRGDDRSRSPRRQTPRSSPRSPSPASPGAWWSRDDEVRGRQVDDTPVFGDWLTCIVWMVLFPYKMAVFTG